MKQAVNPTKRGRGGGETAETFIGEEDVEKEREQESGKGRDGENFWHSGIWGATEEAVLNNEHKISKIQKIPL